MASASKVQFTFSTIAQEQIGKDGVAVLDHDDYQVVFDELGHYVLHRGARKRGKGKS